MDKYLESFVGQEWNLKLEASLHKEHLRGINIFKARDSIAKLKRGAPLDSLLGSLSESMVVAVLKGRNDPTISGVGVNCLDDLFTSNFVSWLAQQFSTPNQASLGYAMKDINGNVQTSGSVYGFPIYSSGYYFNCGWWNSSMNEATASGFQFQFGSGSSVAARSDYKIQTALAVAPESGRFDCCWGSYGYGSVATSSNTVASGSGNIREVGLFGSFGQWSGGPWVFMLTHDILSSNVSYIPGNILIASLLINI